MAFSEIGSAPRPHHGQLTHLQRLEAESIFILREAVAQGSEPVMTLADVIAETRSSRLSERSGRSIDRDGAASMERKKQEGYF